MTRLLAGASTGATLLFAAATGPAFAQQLPDVYPGAVPSMPPAPATGPVPDLAPAAGQDPTPGPSDQCPTGPGARPLPGVDPRGLSGLQPNPLAGERWFVDPREPAWWSYASYARQGRRHDAELMWRVAREPRFRWFGRWTGPDVAAKVRYYLGCAGTLQPGSVPLIVVMRHQGKRCSPTYAAGGPAEDARTRDWYNRFAQGVGNARVVIGFEPDSLGTLECLARHRRRARLDVLRYGVDRLSQLPNATIYLEAGASDWEPARRTASQLRYIGIQKVRGFRGPLHVRRGHRRVNIWCNPPGRGLGPRPTTATGHRLVDAYMWINRPGYSAGSCNGGPLPVGTRWPERALMYARNQTSWLGPPRGTVHGHFRR